MHPEGVVAMGQEAKRRKYSKEFKIEAVRLTRQPGMTVVKAARDLGVRAKDLYRWRVELAEAPVEAFRGQGRRRASDEELERLRRENEQLRMEREILKKATAFFANQPR
jgi:transposase